MIRKNEERENAKRNRSEVEKKKRFKGDRV